MKNKLLWIFAGLAAFVVYSKYKMASSLNYFISNVEFTGGLITPQIIISLSVTNTSFVSTLINSINANISINGNFIGTIQNNINTTILSKGVTNIDLPINVSLLGAAGSLQNIFANKNINLIVTGSIVADGITLPLNVVYNV